MVPLFKARDFLNNVYYSIWGHQGEKLQFIDCPQWMAERIGIRWKESERHFIHSLFQVFQVHHFLITRKDQKPIYMSDVYPSPQCSCHLSMMLYCSGPVLNVSTRNNWAAVKLHIHVWIKNIFAYFSYGPFSSVQFSCSVVSDSLRPQEPQHARPPCPSPTPGVHPNPCPLSQWCHLTISSFVVPFSSCPQSFPASGSFQMSQLFASGGQRIGV